MWYFAYLHKQGFLHWLLINPKEDFISGTVEIENLVRDIQSDIGSSVEIRNNTISWGTRSSWFYILDTFDTKPTIKQLKDLLITKHPELLI